MLIGCAQQVKQVWLRNDGQLMASNPVLAQQFEVDKTICLGDVQKANMGTVSFCRGIVGCAVEAGVRSQQATDVGKGCMAQHGYMMVNEDEADAKAAYLRDLNKPPQQPAATKPKQPVQRQAASQLPDRSDADAPGGADRRVVLHRRL
jgi:hypothetical protein